MLVFRLCKFVLIAGYMMVMLLSPTNEAVHAKLKIIPQPTIVAEEPEPEEEPILTQITYDPFEPTYLNQDEFNHILQGTGLENYGEFFAEMEAEYQVNGVYALAVALYESADGYSGLATSNYNYFGFRGNNGWMSFESPYDGILYFGKLMNYDMYYQKDLEDIAKVYCPGTWSDWTNKIIHRMEGLFDKLDLAAGPEPLAQDDISAL